MNKRVPLVSQYLENISRDVLREHQPIIREFVRRRHGIYALYRRDKLYYVGLAGNLRSRLKVHLRDRHGGSWDRFSIYLTLDNGHVRELESLALRIVQPSGNRQKGKFARAENLRNRLARLVRELHRDQLRNLLGLMSKARRRTKTLRSLETKSAPVLAGLLTGKNRLRGWHKGKTIKARLRKDGSISLKGKIFNSPSLSAAAACGRRTCNGWRFWHYERAPGDWVQLRELRS